MFCATKWALLRRQSQKPDMKKLLLIGRTFSGKTTLCQYLNHEALRYHKTQTIHIVDKRMIDTPGEYLEQRHFRGALSVTSTQADVIGFVQDATESGTMFPPTFGSMFALPTIGIVTKADAVEADAIKRAEEYLRMAGVSRIFVTSSYLGDGFEPLKSYLGYEE